MVSATQFLHQKLVCLVGLLFFSLFSLFRYISTYLFRNTKDSTGLEFAAEGKNEKEMNYIDEDDDEGEKEETSLTFKFPSLEEFIRSKQENGEFFVPPLDTTRSISHCETTSDMGFSGFVEKQEVSFVSCVDGFVEDKISDSVEDEVSGGLSEDMNLKSSDDVIPEVNHEKAEENDEKTEKVMENSSLRGYEETPSEGVCYSEKDSVFTSSDSDSTSFGCPQSVVSFLVDSFSDGFLSDGDFEQEFEDETGLQSEAGSELEFGEKELETEEFEDGGGGGGGGGDDVNVGDLDHSERDLSRDLRNLDSEFLSENDFHENLSSVIEGAEKSGNSEESNKLESLWEHQELIEQLQMELRKVKAIGLPTIFEESESSPKVADDLRPWKIDDKFHHEDHMSELHKIYKSYRERMRKLDILNYQKMYAIGFLQLKDPLQSMTSQKSSGPTLKSLVSQNLRLLKHKQRDSDPMTKFVKDLQSDLEVVYVGQMCLSWEFLHWQYGKALDLWDSDPRGIHQYNEVADEFQQFQVLMQRFLEDEPLQGPRVQHYIKSRCVLRNLLHVPVIREDGLKDRRRSRKREQGEYAITSDVLLEILEESIRIFWRFIRADKNCSSATLKGQRDTSAELQNPADSTLLVEVRNTLLKKERKLKELVRGQHCILRKLKKRREEEDDSDQVLYFFSQVDMKLVSRVLNMSRLTTEQLVWCGNKLNRISFVHRKILVEPSFLLFPC